jgi:uncharacterized protein (TIGR02145 family)
MKTIKQFLLAALLGCFCMPALAQVNKTVDIGETFTISSVVQATPGAEYRWMRNGDILSGATNTSYTGSIDHAAGTYMFIRQARKDGVCNDWMSSNPYVVVVTCGADLVGTNGSQTVCAGTAITDIQYTTSGVSSIEQVNVHGLPAGTTFTWANDELRIYGRPAESGDHVYTVVVCGTDKASGTITRVNIPTITLTTGNNNQSVAQHTATTISYTTTNATGATLTDGSFPAGVSGEWSDGTYTISGTPSGTGTFNYELTTTNSNGCTNATASGVITVIPWPHGAGTKTWTCSTQTWSGPVQIPGCNKDDFNNSDDDPDCRSDNSSGTRYYYYNWPYVNANKATMCPAPWKVPAKDDFIALDICLKGGGDGSNRTGDAATVEKYLNNWGGSYGGYALGSSMTYVGSVGYYWSSSENSSIAYRLHFTSSGGIGPQGSATMPNGFQVRCVK